MIRPTRFPPEWLLKKSREECEQLSEENHKLREENSELKLRVQKFTAKNEAKIAARKEVLYKAIKDEMQSFKNRYSNASKAIDRIWGIACRFPENAETDAYVDSICQILIKYYETNRK